MANEIGVTANSAQVKDLETQHIGAQIITDVASYDDSSLAKWMVKRHFQGKLAYNKSFEWLGYDGTHWSQLEEQEVIEMIRSVHDEIVSDAFNNRHHDADILRSLTRLLNNGKITSVYSLLRGLVTVKAKKFDLHPELLNVGNGVVNLRTGELLPHSPDFYFTKHVSTPYIPDATHPDVTSALSAIPEEEREWMQIRFGQGITGYSPEDDVLPFLNGRGENGKSTIVEMIFAALGEYATLISERVLMANPNDHPTELMTLRGVRLGFIEELPESKHLPVKRLKDLLGVPRLKARYVNRNNVEWTPTHTLVVTTNYLPLIDEVDHATWRRLKLVNFPYKFVNTDRELVSGERRGDGQLRQRLKHSKDGQAEAVLAWLVEGAVKSFADPMAIRRYPKRIEEDSHAWRLEVDKLKKFMFENIEFDSDSHVMTTELVGYYNDWLKANGFAPWSEQTFAARFSAHEDIIGNGVYKHRYSKSEGLSSRIFGATPPKQYFGWTGIKFRKGGHVL